MPKKDEQNLGFENFLNSMLSSAEYKAMVWEFNNIKKQEELLEADKAIKKAWDIVKNFQDIFATPDTIEAWKNYKSSSQTETKFTKTTDEEDDKMSIEVKYFKNDNPKTWWFAGIAGLEDLKQELKESFINPLKFKFLVEKLEWDNALWEKEELYK
jgi:SpoVK/Ycf46/Vps4 family AAA+-type ATPase